MAIVLMVILLGVCGVLIFLVLSQDTKGGGLAGVLGGGGGGGTFSGRGADSVTKLTAYLGAAFFLIVLVIGMTTGGGGGFDPGVMPPKEPGDGVKDTEGVVPTPGTGDPGSTPSGTPSTTAPKTTE